MTENLNIFEIMITELLVEMILDYKVQNYSHMTEKDFSNFIYGREVQVWNDVLSRNVSYHQATTIEKLKKDNYNNNDYLYSDLIFDILPLYNINIKKDIIEKYNMFSFKRILNENKLDIKSYTELFLKDFRHLNLQNLYNECNIYNNFKEGIKSNGLKAFHDKINIESFNMIFFDLLNRFEKDKHLLAFYFNKAIILYKSKFLELHLTNDKNKNLEIAYQILKKIGLFKSRFKDETLILYTSLDIVIEEKKIKLKEYQHHFLIAWFVEYTNVKNFKVILNTKEKTKAEMNNSLRQKKLFNIGSSNFKVSKINMLEIKPTRETNFLILKYLKSFE